MKGNSLILYSHLTTRVKPQDQVIFFPNSYLKSLESFSLTKLLGKKLLIFELIYHWSFVRLNASLRDMMSFFQTTISGNIRQAPILQRNLSPGKLNTCHHTCTDPALLSIPSPQDPSLVPGLWSQLLFGYIPGSYACSTRLVPPMFLAEGFSPLGTKITCWTGSSKPSKFILNK